MQIVITSATKFECMQAAQQLSDENVSFHISGVGLLASAVSLTQLALQRPTLIIQAGIAGCFDEAAELGKVYAIGDEMLGDTGVDENGEWKDMFDLGLEQQNNTPFTEGKLPNPWLQQYNLLHLTVVSSVTINEITTSAKRRQQITTKYNPFVESMEGASLHYACLLHNIPFIQIRATSNYIGERDKTKWKMKGAIANLNEALVEYVKKLAAQ